ncbi:MAG TPA: putative Ig domain-containing protein [Streptosporangiaceae bacterium]|nr:putative Ig domain-containing protein [Streptosporangiaceae bacterium]
MRANHEGGWRIRRRSLAIITPIALIVGGVIAATPAVAGAATTSAAAPTQIPSNWHYACGNSFKPGKLDCLVIKNTTAHPTAQTVRPGAIPSGEGYGPSTFQAAYGLTAASAADGSGTTVAVIDAYNDPTAASDLAEYRSAAGLPALTSGQFTQYNQEGETSPLPATAPTDDDWTLEESLDVDMVSAICPLCKIDLVEATNDSGTGLYVAEETAATTLGAKYISNSWGGSESSTDLTYDTEYFGVSGVVYTASAGDSAYSGGVIYPATSPHVVGVGGTTLDTASNSRGYTESVWETSSTEGTGSGCSSNEPQPSWQSALSVITAVCGFKVDNDTAADADPNTGAAVYDTTNGNGGWEEVGGTSESSPIIASVFALAGNNGNGGENAADSIYTHTSSLYDVTSGSNGSCGSSLLCTAKTGYDGPTGWGTPDGLTAFESNSTTSNTVTVTNPGSQTGTVGTAASLQISASDSASGQTLTYSATGLPAGLSISSSTGLISGTPTTSGSYSVTVTAKDTTGATGSASFTWTINSTTGNTVTVTNPGSQTGTVGTAASLQIKATDSASGQTLTYSATGLPAGLSISSTTGLITGTPTTAAANSVTVTAKDTTGATGSASFTWTISAASSCASQQLLTNGGFETGSISPWTSSAGVLADTGEGVPAQAGSWLAWLDGYGEAHTDTLAQTVTIPAGCTVASLTYWVEVNSTTSSTSNKLVLEILNSSGTVLSSSTVVTAANNDSAYKEYSANLAAYAGDKVTIEFVGTEVNGGNTSFFEDSNALNVS